MNPVDFGSIGILQIGGNRYGFRPLEVYTEFGHAPIMKGEFFSNVFQASNRYQGTGVAYGKIPEPPTIKNVYFNDPVTVVIWNDGTKTIVRCQPGDTYSKETGLALCIAKKYLGNKGNFNEVFKKWIPEETEPVEEAIEVEDKETGAINLLKSGNIGVGDKVRVVRYNQTYTTYRDWVEDHVKDPADAAKWAEGELMRNGDIGVVKYLASHEFSHDGVIAYIEIDNKCYMINVRGLERVGLERVGEISVDDMRTQLKVMCDSRECESFTDNACPLFHCCKCSFINEDMTDDEIRAAYEIVFK